MATGRCEAGIYLAPGTKLKVIFSSYLNANFEPTDLELSSSQMFSLSMGELSDFGFYITQILLRLFEEESPLDSCPISDLDACHLL